MAFSAISILAIPFLIALLCSRKRTPDVPALATETKEEWYARMREGGHLPAEPSAPPTREYPPTPAPAKVRKPRAKPVEDAPTEPLPVIEDIPPTEPVTPPEATPAPTPKAAPRKPKSAPRVHRDAPTPAPAPTTPAPSVIVYADATDAERARYARILENAARDRAERRKETAA